MVCYAVPATAAIAVYALRKTNSSIKGKTDYYLLNLLLLGASIFGFVDHLWNGELFLISEKPLMDLALGATITLTVFASWGIIVALEKAKATKPTIA
ncbi:MAG: hypothetical protein NTU61_01240 [Candidatus Altiarchaeota archaeon]|nr:hypothetical protein [Candidatus Altiarchaeota archaeon]